MKTEIISQEGNKQRIRATIDAQEFQKALNTVVGELSRKANIKGFRKGKVPRNVLEMYFGREGIYTEALEKVLPAAMGEIVEEYDLSLISEPEVDLEGEVEEGKPVTAVFTFEVRPEVILPDLASIVVEKPVVEVTDAMVDEAVEQIRLRHSELKPVENRTSREGDAVSVEYTTQIVEEGKENTASSPQTTTIQLDPESLREELKNALTGKNIGDEESVEITIEAEHPDPSIAGKTLRYNLKVKEILERILPELDEAFVRKTSQDRLTSLEEFRKEVAERIEEQIRRDVQNAMEANALSKLRDAAQVTVPETLIERQVASMKEEEAAQIKKQFNLSMEEYLDKNGIKPETFEQSIRERAERIVRQTLILEALADERSIEVVSQDIEAEIQNLADSLRTDPERIRSLLFKDRERMTDFLHRIRMNKAISQLLSEVTIKEVFPNSAANGTEPSSTASGENS
ncbi:MAG: trigger factor [Synergistaceae bacterium]|nr:trigger factor [Synergistaceae bacterium]